ncbi:MAG: hypothetical protein IKQ24_03690, partial [Verrucomicrobia bacterium]|nr:hypothetical protein [Verrucomicrobiota bacterium]
MIPLTTAIASGFLIFFNFLLFFARKQMNSLHEIGLPLILLNSQSFLFKKFDQSLVTLLRRSRIED